MWFLTAQAQQVGDGGVGWGGFLAWIGFYRLKPFHFRFWENFPSDFRGIVSDFRVGDWVLLGVWGSKAVPSGLETEFRGFPE